MPASRDQRAGYTMVLLAWLLFGFMGVAALVIDLGFARLAHRQMQSAVNSAALEGLRGAGSDSATYEDRQAAARRMMEWTLDKDLNAGNGGNGIADGGSFGSGEVGRTRGASQLPTARFRVAVQRGGETGSDFDVLLEGAAIPYLFAHGASVDRGGLGNGMRVGSTATAESRPAVKVWPPVAGLEGIQPVAYTIDNWGPSPMHAASIISDLAQGLSIGQEISIGPPAPDIATGYCAIVDPQSMRVVGFGMLGQTAPEEGIVATHNASARWSDAWDTLAAIEEDERGEILDRNRSLRHALTAPVLVAED